VFIGIASAPKIAPGDFHEVAKLLKKLIGDGNVNVAQTAIHATEMLAKGLKADFVPYAKVLVSDLLERFKDKKTSVVAALNNTCDAMISSALLVEIVESLDAAFKSKVPAVRANSLAWTSRIVLRTPKGSLSKVAKSMAESFVKCLDDSTPDVRNGAGDAFGALCVVLTTKPFGEIMSKLDAKKKKRIEDFVASNAGTATSVPEPVKATKPAATKPKSPAKVAENVEAMTFDMSDDASQMAPPKRSPPARFSPPKVAKAPSPEKPDAMTFDMGSDEPSAMAPPKRAPPARLTTSKAPASKPTGKKATVVTDEELETGNTMSPEELQSKIAEIIPAEITAGLASKNWKERLEQCDALVEGINGNTLGDMTSIGEVIIRMLGTTPGWKESNFQVVNKMFAIVGAVATNSEKMSKKVAALSMATLTEKVGDMKLRNAASDCLLDLSEIVTPQFVCTQVYKHALTAKSPKVTAEAVGWINTSIDQFGLGHFDIKGLFDFIQQVLENTNPAVKKAALKLLVELRKVMGSALADLIHAKGDDIKPALLKVIDAELGKVTTSDPVAQETTREVRVVMAGKGGKTGKSGGGGAAAAFELPRQDISGQITSKLLKGLADNDWKTRKATLVELDEMLVKAGKRIEPNLGDLMPALKLRLSDKNQSVMMHTITLIGDLAKAVGPPIKGEARVVMAALLTNIGDKKKPIREKVTSVLDLWVEETGIGSLIKYLPTQIHGSPDARMQILEWLLAQKTLLQAPGLDLSEFCTPLINDLQDRSGDVRKLAEQLIEVVVPSVGYEAFTDACNDLKPAVKKTILGILSKFANGGLTLTASELVVKEKAPVAAKTRPSATLNMKRPATTNAVRRTTAPVAAAAAKPTASTEEIADILTMSSGKDKRAKRDKIQKWDPDQKNKDAVQLLQEEMSACMNDDVVKSLFGATWEKHCHGIDLLVPIINPHPKEICSCIDLLLKYSSLRICEGNTNTMNKISELCRAMFDMMTEQGKVLTDHEAALFLPHLCDKLGNNKEHVRTMLQELMMLVIPMYPNKDLFAFLQAGLKSKNSRSRVACLEIMLSMIEGDSIKTVCSPKTLMPQLAEVLKNDRDRAVINSTLIIICRTFSELGDATTWKLLGRIDDQQTQTIKDRLKFAVTEPAKTTSSLAKSKRRPSMDDTARSPPASKLATSIGLQRPSTVGGGNAKRSIMGGGGGASRQPLSSSVVTDEAPSAPMEETSMSATMPVTSTLSASRNGRFGLDFDALETSAKTTEPRTGNLPGKSSPVKDESTDAMKWVEELESQDQVRSIEIMKVICDDILSMPDKVAGQASELVKVLTLQTKTAFIQASETDDVRWCKYVLNTSMQMFSCKQIAVVVSRPTLQALIVELIDRMLDSRTPTMKDGTNMIKALNLLMLRMLDNCSKNSTLSVLLQLLRPTTSQQSGSADLIVRCLLRMSKSLGTDIDNLDIDALFEEVQGFFEAVPQSAAKDSGSPEAMSLRTVKTVVNEVVRLKGPAVRSHLTRVSPSDEKENVPILVQYIDLMLESTQGTKTSKMTAPVCPSDLKSIFAQIDEAQTSNDTNALEEGASELLRYRAGNPHVDIAACAEGSAAACSQGFIRGTLEADVTSGRTPLQATAPSNENVTQNYMSRLHSLQSRYGFKSTSPEKQASPVAQGEEQASEGGDDLTNKYKDRLKYLQSRYGTSGSPPKEAPEPPAKAAASPPAEMQSSVSDLRARLNKVKGLSA